jgi:hypothetical protein
MRSPSARQATLPAFVSWASLHDTPVVVLVDLLWFECELLQGEADVILELPDQKAQDRRFHQPLPHGQVFVTHR